jgi:hypothetical protein
MPDIPCRDRSAPGDRDAGNQSVPHIDRPPGRFAGSRQYTCGVGRSAINGTDAIRQILMD